MTSTYYIPLASKNLLRLYKILVRHVTYDMDNPIYTTSNGIPIEGRFAEMSIGHTSQAKT